jgi:hypothetical protein
MVVKKPCSESARASGDQNLQLGRVQRMKGPVWRESPVIMRQIEDAANGKDIESKGLPGEFLSPTRSETEQ